MELSELITLMRKDTLKYIEDYNFNKLVLFIDGFLLYKTACNIPLSNDEKNFSIDFETWVFKYYDEMRNNSIGGWDNLILFKTKGLHIDAINEFFKLYDKWVKQGIAI